MNCELTKDGILILTSETDLEEYALKSWHKEQIDYENYHDWDIEIKSKNKATDGVNDGRKKTL